MFDLFTFQRWKPAHYISPPSVAFVCRQVQHPKSMKKFDLCFFPEKVNLMEEMELRLHPNRIAEVHNFEFYRECLELCISTTFNQQHFRFKVSKHFTLSRKSVKTHCVAGNSFYIHLLLFVILSHFYIKSPEKLLFKIEFYCS